MIIDYVSNLTKYEETLPSIKKIVEIIKSGVLDNIEIGQYKSDDPKVRYNVFEYDTVNEMSETFEIHQKEIDVQIILEGHERMDIAWATPTIIVKPYDSNSDAAFVKGELCSTLYTGTARFVIFFPGEPHAPSLKDYATCKVKKVVFKVLA